jgi:plastocyanin
MTRGKYPHTFKTKGTYMLMCTIHGFTMKVKVT